MFTLKGTVSRNSNTDLDDSATIKMAMTSLGYYDDADNGFSAYGDDKLFKSIKSYQKDKDLKVDGVIKADGPTQEKIKQDLNEDKSAGNAFGDFWRNYMNMREANTKKSDKYFHCMANYEATQRGWLGEEMAETISDLREIRKSDDYKEDKKANKYGRETAKSGKFKTAREACAIFRPEGLDEKY